MVTDKTPKNAQSGALLSHERRPLTHLLIPASNPSQHLCKLLLTASTLGYPHPHLLAWNQTFNNPGMMSGGSHIAKIQNTLKYLNNLGESRDDDLVLMVDGYDLWFQLPVDVLVSRYYEIVAQTDARLIKRYGPTAMRQVRKNKLEAGLSNRVIFGAGKRCAPNQPHTMACYALIDSPLPDDLYGKNTDWYVGWNQYTSLRQRYLNSGFVMGPIAEMRRLFSRAGEMANGAEQQWLRDNRLKVEPTDNGSGQSEYFYHGSDQSIFAKILGRQEFVREVLRRRFDPEAGKVGDKRRSSILEGTPVDNIINPSFHHERWDDDKFWKPQERYPEAVHHRDPWKEDPAKLLETYDFGITLDYWSDLGHQTVNSERDATWLTHGQRPLSSQIDFNERGLFDCPLHLDSLHSKWGTATAFPSDIQKSLHPSQARGQAGSEQQSPNPWLTTPLYTHLCLSNPHFSRIPVMIHHNGDKRRRDTTWHQMSWLYNSAQHVPSSEQEAEEQSAQASHDAGDREGWLRGFAKQGPPSKGGAWTAKGLSMSWGQLCPAEMIDEGKLFGDDAVA